MGDSPGDVSEEPVTQEKRRAHSPSFPSLHLRHSSLSNFSATSHTSQLILQPFRHLTYVTTHSPTLPSLYLSHSSFSYPYIALPKPQLILQTFRCFSYAQLILQHFHHFTYVTTHSPTLPLLYLSHSSFSNPSVASPTSQFILQSFFCFSQYKLFT